MNPWVVITFVMAGIVFGLDYLFRRKKWKENATEEKISLLINMFSVGPYIFLSALGMLWGITATNPNTALGEVLYIFCSQGSVRSWLFHCCSFIIHLLVHKG